MTYDQGLARWVAIATPLTDENDKGWILGGHDLVSENADRLRFIPMRTDDISKGYSRLYYRGYPRREESPLESI